MTPVSNLVSWCVLVSDRQNLSVASQSLSISCGPPTTDPSLPQLQSPLQGGQTNWQHYEISSLETRSLLSPKSQPFSWLAWGSWEILIGIQCLNNLIAEGSVSLEMTLAGQGTEKEGSAIPCCFPFLLSCSGWTPSHGMVFWRQHHPCPEYHFCFS